MGTGGASGEVTAAGRPPQARTSRAVAADRARKRVCIVPRYIGTRHPAPKQLTNHALLRLGSSARRERGYLSPSPGRFYLFWSYMIREMREKLSREVDQLS